jgi:cytochrome c oxidase subunit 1
VFGHDAVVLIADRDRLPVVRALGHHMFATNVPELGKSFFTAMSFMIAIPTALQIFCWIATLAAGGWSCARRPVRAGFFFVSLIGGLTGIMLDRCRSISRSTTRTSSSPTSTTC